MVIQIRGNFDDGMRLVQEIAAEHAGERRQLDQPLSSGRTENRRLRSDRGAGRRAGLPCLPVGNAGNISAHWMGYSEAVGKNTASCSHCEGDCRYLAKPIATHRPIMLGYQAAGAAPFLRGAMVDEPETVATAIRIGHPVSWKLAWAAKSESGGWFNECTDEEILRAQKLLAEKEGIFCEPASGASIAGVLKDLELGVIGEGTTIVCTLTGHGLKDPDTAIAQSSKPVVVNATRAAIERVIGENLPK